MRLAVVSESWIEHISMPFYKELFVVNSVEEVLTSNVIGTRQEKDIIYSYKFRMNDNSYSRFEIEMRNSSNGYYGGSMEQYFPTIDEENWTELKESF